MDKFYGGFVTGLSIYIVNTIIIQIQGKESASGSDK